MTGVLAALAGMAGASGTLDSQTVTSGLRVGGSNPTITRYGWDGTLDPDLGVISPGTCSFYGDAAILALFIGEDAYDWPPIGFAERYIQFVVDGSRVNGGWTRMIINGTAFTRVSATYLNSGGQTSWTWYLPVLDPYESGIPGPFSVSTTVTWE
jgi:hypothetical protein